jgi:hypothetical protein
LDISLPSGSGIACGGVSTGGFDSGGGAAGGSTLKQA